MHFDEFCSFFRPVMALNGFERFTDDAKSRMFYDLTERMLEVNQSMNLTAIKDPRAVVLLHYVDSLTAEPFLPQNARVADVGCGAGFPCLPLAICRSDLEILAIDSTEKRIRYVQDTATRLHCPNLTAITARAEEAGQGELRDSFDVCTARAVASLPALCELCLPLVKVGGTFLAMKGRKGEEELREADTAIRKLGGECIAMHKIKLIGNNEEDTRYLIEIKKISPTPESYPRPWGKILKKPL